MSIYCCFCQWPHMMLRKRSFVMKLDKTHVTVILYTLNAHLIIINRMTIIRNKCYTTIPWMHDTGHTAHTESSLKVKY